MASMACVSLAMFLGAMSQTVVATTLPLIIADLGGFDRYTWVAVSYVVAATLTFPIVGRLSDIFGRRLFLLLGLTIFNVASLLIGLCETMNQVVACRALQGLGGGTIMTCCYIAIADLFPPRDRGRFHGLLSGVYGMSFVAGPILGGFLADTLSWKWAFVLISLYADSTVSVATVMMLLVSFGLYGSVLFLPLVFQVAFGFSATQSGGLLTPMLLGTALGGVVAGSVLSRASGCYRILALVCAVLMTAGLFLLSTPKAMTNVVWSQFYVVVASLGMGGIIATLTVGVQNHVPFGVVGVATSALQ